MGNGEEGVFEKFVSILFKKTAPEMFGKGAKRYIVSFDARNVRRTRRLICCTILLASLHTTTYMYVCRGVHKARRSLGERGLGKE